MEVADGRHRGQTSGIDRERPIAVGEVAARDCCTLWGRWIARELRSTYGRTVSEYG